MLTAQHRFIYSDRTRTDSIVMESGTAKSFVSRAAAVHGERQGHAKPGEHTEGQFQAELMELALL